MSCMFCHQPCGDRDFCDEACKKEHDDEQAIIQESIKEDGIAHNGDYHDKFYEPNEWDVIGGL